MNENSNQKVIKFLTDHGYTSTSQTFTNEATQYQNEELRYYRNLIKPKSSSLILNKNITKEHSIIKQYSKLKEFVYKNNEIYRGELSQILFPIFCYSYLFIVKQQKYNIRSPFLSKFQNEFLHSKHKSDFLKLMQIEELDDIYQNDYARKILKEKFLVVLSKESFELILKFFEDNQFFIFKSFSNRFINFILSSSFLLSQDSSPISSVTGNSQKHQQKFGEVIKQNDRKGESLNIVVSKIDEKTEPFLPSISLFTFFNQEPINIMISERLIVSSYNDSSIKISHLESPNINNMVDLIGHSGPVYNFDTNNNFNWLLSCSQDSTVRLWNLKDNRQVVIYRGHQYVIWDVKFAKFNDNLFVTGSHDKTARVWVTNRISPVRILAGHLSDVEVVQFHPNSSYVATGSTDKTIRLWDINTGVCVRIFIAHTAPITSLEFDPSGKYLFSGSEDSQIIQWDLTQGKCMTKFKEHHFSDICSIKALDSKIVTCSLDFSIKIWDYKQTNKCIKSFYTKNTGVLDMKVLKNNVVLAAGIYQSYY